MRSWAAMGFLAAALAGCSGIGKDSEDFSLQIERPAEEVLAAFGDVDASDSALVFPGMTIDRTEPSGHEILYTIPGSDEVLSTVRLSFEAANSGKGTIVRAFVDVPPVPATLDGVRKVASEDKIEKELETVLKQMKASLESNGTSDTTTMAKLSSLLIGVAIATNSDYLQKAVTLEDDPEEFAELIGALEPDPEANERADDTARDDSGWAGESEPQDDTAAAQDWNEQARAEPAEY